MKRVSIKDIAKKAGVVPSTVSLVLNGKAKQMRISDELAIKIKAIADETGFIPNQTAVSLRTGKTKILGLIVEDISNVFFASLAKFIEDEANSLGFKIVYCSTDNNDQKGSELIRVLSHRQVDGFLITPSRGMLNDVKKLLEQKKPLVLMDRYFPDMNTPYVLVDNYNGVKQGIEHLINKGYGAIAFITVDIDQFQMQERERAYRETLEMHQLPRDESLLFRLPFHLKGELAVESIALFIQSHPKIDAIFFATNYIAVHGLESIRNLGLVIPGNLAVISFDDHDFFRLLVPGITCVRQPIDAIAKTAVQFLIRQFEKIPVPFKELQQMETAGLIVRGST